MSDIFFSRLAFCSKRAPLTRLTGFLRLCVTFGVASWMAAAFGHAEFVYDNTATYLEKKYGALDEFGDEINLAGTARILTNFAFEYYGGFQPNGTQRARIQFHLNDGPLYKKYPTPGTVFYDSGYFELGTNYTSKYLELPYIQAPSMFTWTVTFEGLSQTPGDEAGLLVCSPPTVGAVLAGGRIGSYNDYWQKKGDKWALFTFSDGTPANFSARLGAEEERVQLTPFAYPNGKALGLRWRGKQGSTFLVQRSTTMPAQWEAVGAAQPDAEAYVNYVAPIGENSAESLCAFRVVRLASGTEPAQLTMTQDDHNGGKFLRYLGNPGGWYEFQISDVKDQWMTITNMYSDPATGTFICGDPEASGHPNRQYRAVRPTSGSLMPRLSIESASGARALRWRGAPGAIGMVMTSTNLTQWNLLGTTEADQNGDAALVLTNTVSGEARFFRLLQP